MGSWISKQNTSSRRVTLTVGEMLNNKTARSQSVSIAGDGIEIGRLQIHMDEKRTSHIKSQILEARLDEPSTEQTGRKCFS